MKILIITPFYYIEGRPDLKHDTKAVHYFAKYWAKDNEVKVFNVYPHSYKSINRYCSKKNRAFYKNGYIFKKDDVEVCLSEIQKYPTQKGKYNYWQCKHIINLFNKWISNESFQADIILVHVPSYAYTYIDDIKKCFDPNIPVLGILHMTDIEELNRDNNLKRMLEKNFSSLYARSHGVRKNAIAHHLSNFKKEIIQSGVPIQKNLEESSPYKILRKLQIVYAGKLIPRKNVDAIIEAIKKIKNQDIHLSIIGTGKEEKKLKRITKKFDLQKQITFVGNLPRERVLDAMAKANLFCMPSYSETLGLTYLEAMSVGCVPIGTRGEGIDGVIFDKKNGYLVNPDDLVSDLIKKINFYCQIDDAARKKISQNAKTTAMQLEESVSAVAYLDIIKRNIKDVK